MSAIQITDREEYSLLFKKAEFSFLQSWEWGDVKSSGWRPVRFHIDGIPGAILTRALPVVGGRFGYMPRAFSSETINIEILKNVSEFAEKELGLSHLLIDPNCSPQFPLKPFF